MLFIPTENPTVTYFKGKIQKSEFKRKAKSFNRRVYGGTQRKGKGIEQAMGWRETFPKLTRYFHEMDLFREGLPKHKKDETMSDLKQYIDERKKRETEFADNYEKGYEQFKIGIMLRQARESVGLTQEELAKRLNTKKTAISRIENHAEDIKLSTLERVASALGKHLRVSII